VIVKTCANLVLDYVPHKDMEIMVIKPSEEVMESLEGHQMELQSMVSPGHIHACMLDACNTQGGRQAL
jgi:hypothetical protein